jgi:hypothetical protein
MSVCLLGLFSVFFRFVFAHKPRYPSWQSKKIGDLLLAYIVEMSKGGGGVPAGGNDDDVSNAVPAPSPAASASVSVSATAGGMRVLLLHALVCKSNVISPPAMPTYSCLNLWQLSSSDSFSPIC